MAVGGSEVVLIDLNVEPLTGTTSHNGGALHFGADGKLYVSVGDNAQGNNSQSLGNRLGKILRLNADGTIPEDNPFFGTATGVNRAIWAMGLRNPYTFSVQPGTGRIFINDVGQNAWEEINDGIAGANYGWVNCEGPNTLNTDVPCDPAFDLPFHAYDRRMTDECAIIGGAFYNPATVQYPAAFLNQYFFTDLCGGWIRTIDPATGIVSPFATGIVQPVDMRLSSDGSIHYLARSGSVYRINYSPPGNAHPGAAADFDGNGVEDLAVYRRSNGTWRVRNQFTVQWGDAGDVPVPGDYNGDGTTDLAVYRPSTGQWFVRNQFVVQFGDPSDVPVPGDYNNDGTTDLAVYRPSTSQWFVRNQFALTHGSVGDVPVPADYTGDGAIDVAVYRPSTGTWLIRNQAPVEFGNRGDVPVPADYTGNGAVDIAVYRPSTGLWLVQNQAAVPFGSPGDMPVPRDFNGDLMADIAVYRPSTGEWFVRDQFTLPLGGPGEIPVPRGPALADAMGGDYNGDARTDVARLSAVDGPVVRAQPVRGAVRRRRRRAGACRLQRRRRDRCRGVPAVHAARGTRAGCSPCSSAMRATCRCRATTTATATMDVAVYRPSDAQWFVGNQFIVQFGEPNDIPVPGDYNGDGRADLAVYRPSTGQWTACATCSPCSSATRATCRSRATTTATGRSTWRCIARPRGSGSCATSSPCSSGTRATCRSRATTTATGWSTSRSTVRQPGGGSCATGSSCSSGIPAMCRSFASGASRGNGDYGVNEGLTRSNGATEERRNGDSLFWWRT